VFLVDGPVLLAEATAAGATIEAVYAEPPMLDDPSVRAAGAAGASVHETAPGALTKVLDLKSSRGVVAVVAASRVTLGQAVASSVERKRPLLVLMGLQDPGNVGTLVRVAEAAGCAGVVLTSGSVDLHNPKTVRATAGAVFRMLVAEEATEDEVLERCAGAGLPVFATVGRSGTAVDRMPLRGALAVLVGPEAHGLDPDLVRRCAGALSVPMEGRAESLNAAIAGSVVLFEAARQRRNAPAPSPSSGSGTDSSGGVAPPMGHNDPEGLRADGDHGRPQG
jgi:RNA methyltransferase, TrmH family